MNDALAAAVCAAARATLLATVCFAPTLAAATPQDLVLMLDNSGSMRRNDPQGLTGVAVRAFLERLDGDYHVAIIGFDQSVNVLMPLTRLDDASRDRFLDSIRAIDHAGLLTNSPAALERSLYELRQHGRPGAHRSIIFMTDGIVDVAPEGRDAGDVEKARWMKTTLAEEAALQQVRIFGIAFTDDADFELIQTLARRTAGEYYRAYAAADVDDVFDSVRARLAEVDVTAPATTPPAARVPAPPRAPLPAPAPGNAAPAAAAGSDAPVIPRTVLPESTLPPVALPAARADGTATPDTDAATTAAGTASSATGTADDAPPASPAPPQQAPAAAPPPGPTPAPTTDTLPALALGALAVLLALAALAITVLRRRPGTNASPVDESMPKAYLNDIDGSTPEKSYELAGRPVIVGRLRGPATEAADYIVIDESTVGRRHAIIDYRDHAFWISDQNSLNGTFVNNTRIETPTRLKHGDRIRFHRHEFEFLVLEMFETDRTMMSDTLFADLPSRGPADDDDTQVRDDDATTDPSSRSSSAGR